ncbi:DNA/RNA non-specific endonuclease [Archangium lipolyticum]|uniref:DNA/RNA non-specific endonuclease n=1 Tax=Archangium lipolyticum TaxID=2970465 RepID=UPI00214A7DE2|nr:DNA/RNA non-specific endonuclease [Archangium lipolyticum]
MSHNPHRLGVLACIAWLLTACVAQKPSIQPGPPLGAPPPEESQDEASDYDDDFIVDKRRAQFTKFGQAEAGFTPEQERRIEANCPFGLPRALKAWEHGPTRYVIREGYVLQHSGSDKLPLWVCEGVERAQLEGNLPRPGQGAFKPDPELPKGERAELADYKGSGYSRGHMAPAGNQTVDQQRKTETFYLSNMVPQLQVHNGGIWSTLENTARQWAQDRGKAYIITGPMFYDPAEEDPNTADGFVDVYRIGANALPVPTHFFKIVVAQNASGQWEAIAFVQEHRGYDKPYDSQLPQTIQSVDWIEERAGFDFMPDLEDEQQQALEASPSPMWQ